jgi:hypothetical protein
MQLITNNRIYMGDLWNDPYDKKVHENIVPIYHQEHIITKMLHNLTVYTLYSQLSKKDDSSL